MHKFLWYIMMWIHNPIIVYIYTYTYIYIHIYIYILWYMVYCSVFLVTLDYSFAGLSFLALGTGKFQDSLLPLQVEPPIWKQPSRSAESD